MKKFLVVFLSLTILCGLVGCSSFEDVLGSVVKYAESQTAQYEAIFAQTEIVHSSPVFGTNNASYAKKDEDGTILCTDYAYKNDIVTAWAETTYIPVEGYTEDKVLELERLLRLELDYLDLLECCRLQMTHSGDYLKVSCVFTDVDKEENYTALYRAELTDQETAVSMKASEDLLLGENYVKK